jgi:hypothetical protein
VASVSYGGAKKVEGSEVLFGSIYYWHSERQIFLMLFLYRKSEQNDLSASQRRILAKAVREEFR